MEEVSGSHLGWLFDQWVYGVGSPSVETSWTWRDGQLAVSLVQKANGAPFSAPVQIEIGPDLRREVWLGAGETRLVLDTDSAPPWVAVDPDRGVLARWNHRQEAESWLMQARQSPSPNARFEAIKKLGKESETDEIRGVLRDIALDAENHHTLRQAAVRSLGKLGSSDAVDAIVEAAGSEDRDVRETAVDTLGTAVSTPAILTRLSRLASHDRDATVRASAVAALAELAPSRGASMARSVLSRRDDDPRSIAHVTALRTLGTHGTAADFPLLLRHIDANKARDVRGAATHAAFARFGKEDEAFRERQRAQLAAPLVRALDDPDLRTRQGAVASLGRTYEPSAEAPLLRLASQTPVQRPDMADLARDAAALIRRGPPEDRDKDSQEDGEEAEDLERILQRLDDLQERLKRLEEWR